MTLGGFVLYQWAVEVYRKRLEKKAKELAAKDGVAGDDEDGCSDNPTDVVDLDDKSNAVVR